MKKLILITVLGIAVVSCSLLDNEAYQEMKRERAERGVKCYRYSGGYVHCEDRDENRY
ncbi:hypothetical protein JCM16775_0222 [Leptotrichia hofstadii]|uniref:Lipoprotein n=1 Tax=Leptotrichia hofstadii TaxID=157688 RepID=A0A510JE19_9FUSO|nr:hypothetical protein [Leptotrichia hofstadii]BBM37538.1 hypothetical protein JCM16775_0222 [Leptotrichia hofstadii]